MKTIKVQEYNASMGPLIDLEEPITYNNWHVEGAVNIPFQKLSYNFKELLDPNQTYYIYCKGGNKSGRICRILEIYHYKAVQVLL